VDVAEVDPSDRQLAILRYLRDHGVATAATIAHEVLRAPRTTFGRTLRLPPAERELAALVARGLALESRRGRRAEFMLTAAGRQLLRDAPLRRPNAVSD
jgi:DNA-binding IclR family transcriptional regulator